MYMKTIQPPGSGPTATSVAATHTLSSALYSLSSTGLTAAPTVLSRLRHDLSAEDARQFTEPVSRGGSANIRWSYFVLSLEFIAVTS